MKTLKMFFIGAVAFVLTGCSTASREAAEPSRCAAEASAVSHIENLRAVDDSLPSLKAIDDGRRKALAQCMSQEPITIRVVE